MGKTNERRDPFPVYCFKVELTYASGGALVSAGEAFFKSVSGLKSETEVVDFKEGGVNTFAHRLVGPTKWSNLVLKRGFSSDTKLLDYREKWALEKEFKRINGTIFQLRTDLSEARKWRFKEGWPCKWELGEFDASKNELMIETLEIAHHGLEKA